MKAAIPFRDSVAAMAIRPFCGDTEGAFFVGKRQSIRKRAEVKEFAK